MSKHVSIKVKRDVREYQAVLAGIELPDDNRYQDNLAKLIEDAMRDLPRTDVNLGSEAGQKLVANHVAKRMLTLSKAKDWWDTFHYLF